MRLFFTLAEEKISTERNQGFFEHIVLLRKNKIK
jgi:hypothetical protein